MASFRNIKNGKSKYTPTKKSVKNRKEKSRTTKHPNSNHRSGVERELAELFKYDPRGPNSEGSDLVSLNVNEALPIQVITDANRFYAAIHASISYALSRGWSANVLDDSFPFFAWIYMGRALTLFAQGGTVETGNVPKWFSLLIQAVIKTRARLGSAEIQYQFQVGTEASEVWVTGIGPIVYGRAMNLGVKSNSVLINSGIPTIVAPSPYTDQKGVAAVQSLWVFLAGLHRDDPMHKMVPMNEHNIMTNDPSAFAVNEVWPGNGIYRSGGPARRSTLEVGIPRPLFSVFSVKPTTSTAFSNRFPNKVVNTSGDALSLGANLVYNMSEKELSVRTPPNIKFVDFGEVLSVLYSWVREVIAKEVQTSFFLDAFEKDSSYFSTKACPLTIQEVALMFRQTVLSSNIDDQIAYQGHYPRVPTSSSDEEFVAYVASQGTVPVPMSSMPLMPMLLKENLNALRGRRVHASDKGTNPLIWSTVYGEFFGTAFSRKDYTVTFNSGETTIIEYVFADDTGEIPISRIDGQYGLNEYAAINDPSYLLDLVVLWNEWLQGLTDTARGLATMGSDDGVNALYMGGMTRYWINQVEDGEEEVEDEIRSTPPIKMTKDKRIAYNAYLQRVKDRRKEVLLDQGPYRDKAIIAYTSNYTVFKSPWQTLQQFWIAPVIKISTKNLNEGDTTGVYMQGAMYREPRSLVPAQGVAFFPTLDASHKAYAALMTKMPFAEPAEYQKVLMDMSCKGEAGILATVSGALVAELGATGAHVAGNLIKQLVPL